MSVSMLLNAADVVTAAERCHAIDEKTGRIPINFLLSSTDLDDHVKDQLQQLAATSSTISIYPVHPSPSNLHDATTPHAPCPDDAIMTDVNELPHHTPHPHPEQHAANLDPVPMCNFDTPRRRSSIPLERNEDEEEALKDIDRETTRPDRATIRRNQKRNQTLTRKAIRKHTGGNKVNTKENTSGMDSSSTTRNTNTTIGSDCMQGSVASSASQQSNTPRRRWKEWEDQLLIQVVADHGASRWNSLAKHFPGRNGRQVRLRWMNHLQPTLDKRPWRPEEDQVLLEAHRDLGNKWALISMSLGGRTDNSVKNRYKSIVRRNARDAKCARKQE